MTSASMLRRPALSSVLFLLASIYTKMKVKNPRINDGAVPTMLTTNLALPAPSGSPFSKPFVLASRSTLSFPSTVMIVGLAVWIEKGGKEVGRGVGRGVAPTSVGYMVGV